MKITREPIIIRAMIPISLDPRIIDMTKLEKWFGSVKKKFNNYEKKMIWINKAKKLNTGVKI